MIVGGHSYRKSNALHIFSEYFIALSLNQTKLSMINTYDDKFKSTVDSLLQYSNQIWDKFNKLRYVCILTYWHRATNSLH